ncbi:MAG: hypothetical protein M1593_03565 [Candidatus Thermoplasmatota archaeon]|jgi:hypothetical protein|nr:hypothetical protein [Candidatus Thermoplasmatota archaeon]
MDKDYISINMIYISQAFIYLLAGTILFFLRGSVSVPVSSESISVIWLFGFVTSMIFGITNIMVPSYAMRIPFSINVVKAEIFFLDIAIILLSVAMNVSALRVLFVPAVLVLILSILIHTYDLMSVSRRPKKIVEGRENQASYTR